jgi:hypothetical protein
MQHNGVLKQEGDGKTTALLVLDTDW